MEKKRDEIISMLETAKESVKPVALDQASVGRLSRMDALQSQAMALAVERRRKDELNMTGAALKLIEDGDYGYCVSCGLLVEPIREHFESLRQICGDNPGIVFTNVAVAKHCGTVEMHRDSRNEN